MAFTTLSQPRVTTGYVTVSAIAPSSTKSNIKSNSKISARELMPIYWRKLIELGVPINEAKAIAWIVARYDVACKVPGPHQQLLVRQYCRFLCRAGLWRASLLLTLPECFQP